MPLVSLCYEECGCRGRSARLGPSSIGSQLIIMEPDTEIEEVACSVCYSSFRRPTTLPCGHTFCFSCINNFTRQHPNCPICRHHLPTPTSKIRPDVVLSSFLDQTQRQQPHKQPQQPSSSTSQCKQERLLLIDLTSDSLLLPFSRISATFQLQSNMLIDRMERFVARQEAPFNQYGVISRLIHIEQLRRNLYKADIQGLAFTHIKQQQIKAQPSMEPDEEEYFYRSCVNSEIIELSNTSPQEYALFFEYFERLSLPTKQQLYQTADLSLLTADAEPIALFYSILAVLNLKDEQRYRLAVSFSQKQRIEGIKNHILQKEAQLKQDPTHLIRSCSKSTSSQILCLSFIALALIVLLFGWHSWAQL